jgi:hypothetical protein
LLEPHPFGEILRNFAESTQALSLAVKGCQHRFRPEALSIFPDAPTFRLVATTTACS